VKETTTVMLLKPHTHDGAQYQEGFFLALEPKVADWLIEQGVAVESRAGPVRVAPRIMKRGCCGGRW